MSRRVREVRFAEEREKKGGYMRYQELVIGSEMVETANFGLLRTAYQITNLTATASCATMTDDRRSEYQLHVSECGQNFLNPNVQGIDESWCLAITVCARTALQHFGVIAAG